MSISDKDNSVATKDPVMPAWQPVSKTSQPDQSPVKSVQIKKTISHAFTALTLLISLAGTVVSGLSLASYYMPAVPQTVATDLPQPALVNTDYGSGRLSILSADGQSSQVCLLKSTKVQATITGNMARVTVLQRFANQSKSLADAIYTFPLADSGAVDAMTMRCGERVVKGEIKTKAAAKAIFNQAKSTGKTAALLEQERTNIFHQSLTNIPPGQEIEITISYVELLDYVSGQYKFVIPTTVGPRFNPTGQNGIAFEPGSVAYRDAQKQWQKKQEASTALGEKIENPGPIDISVDISEGSAIQNIHSHLHKITKQIKSANEYSVAYSNSGKRANCDFILDIDVAAADEAKDSLITYRDTTTGDKYGYALFSIVPPHNARTEIIKAKEMIYLVDCSGSQSGAPLQKAKDALDYIVDNMGANDTFQILAFSDHVETLASQSLPNTKSNRVNAHLFIKNLEANGGTWVAPAVQKVLDQKPDRDKLRIVTFMTDGFVTNDYEILAMVKKYRGNSRWFTFGTGDGVNRTLIDGIARLGGGVPEYITTESSATEAGSKFYKRIQHPLLTNVTISATGLELDDVYPSQKVDLFDDRPLYFTARYKQPGTGKINIKADGYEKSIAVTLPESSAGDTIAKLWARRQIDELMERDYMAVQSAHTTGPVQEQITAIALKHKLLSQYTSFVAVDQKGENAAASVINKPTADGGLICGATNGTIAPAWTNGIIEPQSDATLVQGVNTAGTVMTKPQLLTEWWQIFILALSSLFVLIRTCWSQLKSKTKRD